MIPLEERAVSETDRQPTTPHTENPAPRLEAAFRRIHRERMAGLPVLNPHIEIEAVGFRAWQGQWIGILTTPWAIGLYILPGGGEWPEVGRGGRYAWSLPKGGYLFLVDEEEGVGAYHVCSLMSPVKQFGDQQTARAAAELALDEIMAPTEEPTDAAMVPDEGGETRRAFIRRFADR